MKRFLFLVLAQYCAAVSHASSLGVSPIKIHLSAKAPIATVNLENKGSESVTVQSQVQIWSQSGGKDILADTKDVIVFPPIFKIAPGSTQVVRLGLRRSVDVELELSYRLFLEEVPPPPKAGTVAVVVKHSLPVFVAPKSAPRPTYSADLKSMPNGKYAVTITNTGKAHLQFFQWQLRNADGKVLAEQIGPGYLLPGQSRLLSLNSMASLQQQDFQLFAKTDAGELSAPIRASP